jgi:hypothetical protein
MKRPNLGGFIMIFKSKLLCESVVRQTCQALFVSCCDYFKIWFVGEQHDGTLLLIQKSFRSAAVSHGLTLFAETGAFDGPTCRNGMNTQFSRIFLRKCFWLPVAQTGKRRRIQHHCDSVYYSRRWVPWFSVSKWCRWTKVISNHPSSFPDQSIQH